MKLKHAPHGGEMDRHEIEKIDHIDCNIPCYPNQSPSFKDGDTGGKRLDSDVVVCRALLAETRTPVVSASGSKEATGPMSPSGVRPAWLTRGDVVGRLDR
ncbi:hypothetical protein Taro_031880 [Colocasia esculenta]|uniref:Uncharacterized protein n=1 Tax=Colocasia esculenta TaxID=4460 RepID=A0A843VXS6_COLES|nr:hypothetical protein [Colocasia esculenta]